MWGVSENGACSAPAAVGSESVVCVWGLAVSVFSVLKLPVVNTSKTAQVAHTYGQVAINPKC